MDEQAPVAPPSPVVDAPHAESPPQAPLAWGLRQGLLVGLVRAAIGSAVLTAVFGWVGWPLAGAALGASTVAVEAWARRCRPGRRTALLAAAWTALVAGWAVGWGQLQGIYLVALLRTGSPSGARDTAIAAYRGLVDARWRETGLWYEALPWLKLSGASPRTPLLILAVAAGLTALLRLGRHMPLGGARLTACAQVAGSPVVLPPLGLLLAVLAVQAIEREAWPALVWRVIVGEAATGDKDHLLAAFGLALLAGFMIPLSASLSDLVARRPAGAADTRSPGRWATRSLLPAALGLWLGMVTIPAQGWPSTRDEGLWGAQHGPAIDRAAALELLRKEVDLDDDEVRAVALACLRHADPGVRGQALLLLGEAPFRGDTWAVIQSAALEPDMLVRRTAWAVLRTAYAPGGGQDLQRLLASRALCHRDPGVRLEAWEHVDLLSTEALAAWIERGACDPAASVRRAAASEIGDRAWEGWDRERLVALGRRLLRDPDPTVRVLALERTAGIIVRVDELPELRPAVLATPGLDLSWVGWSLVNLSWSDPAAAELLALGVLAGRWEHLLDPLLACGDAARAFVPQLRVACSRSRDPREREALEQAIERLTRGAE